jgi:hypothetical protein
VTEASIPMISTLDDASFMPIDFHEINRLNGESLLYFHKVCLLFTWIIFCT